MVYSTKKVEVLYVQQLRPTGAPVRDSLPSCSRSNFLPRHFRSVCQSAYSSPDHRPHVIFTVFILFILADPPAVCTMSSIIVSALLYTFLPLASAILLLVLFSGQPTRRSQIRSFLRSLTVFPVLDFLARLWPLQPFLPVILFSLLSLFIFTLLFSLFLHLLSLAFANTIEFISALFRSLDLAPFFALLRPFDEFTIPPQVSDSFSILLSTLSDTISTISTTQLSECTQTNPLTLATKPDRWSQLLHLLRSLAICPPVSKSLPSITSATSDLLASVNLPSFFNTTTLPSQFLPALDELSTAFHGVAAYLNLTELLVDNNLSPGLLASLNRVPVALTQLRTSANFTHILATATRRPAAQEAISTIRAAATDPRKVIPICFPPEQFTSTSSVVREFLASMPLSVRLALVFIVLSIVSLPLLFVVRAAVVESMKKVLTTRYYEATPAAERDVSGWLRAGASVALGVALAEALPLCAICGALAGAGITRGLGLALHALSSVPLHVATQVRVTESIARADVLKDGGVNVNRVLAVMTLVHAAVGMWWNSGAVLIVALGPWMAVLVDAMPVLVAVVWGWMVWRRVVLDERRMAEDRERKDD